MFFVFLGFSKNKGRAGELMASHNRWIARGFDGGVFLLVGSLQPREGGAVVAHNTTISDLQLRVNEDPFLIEDVVTEEITEMTPARADDRPAFLLA